MESDFFKKDFSRMLDDLGGMAFRMMPKDVKLGFFILFERWKNPVADYKTVYENAYVNSFFEFTEFSVIEQERIRIFFKHYVKTDSFRKWITDFMEYAENEHRREHKGSN